MKTLLFLLSFCLFAFSAYGQARPITQQEYEKAHRFALSATNEQFPFIHTFTAEYFDGGELVSRSVQIAERQAPGIERQTFSTTESGKTLVTYQLRTGYGDSVYCSTDGKSWTGPQSNECPRNVRVFGRRTAASVAYSVEEHTVSGESLKIYRKYMVFTDGKVPTFEEEIATINAKGLFVATTYTMGTVEPKSVTVKLVNSWKLKAAFDPITKPKNAKPSEPDNDLKFTIRAN